MKSLVQSSFLLIFVFLTACSPGILKGFHKTGTSEIPRSELYPVFQQTDSIHIFNMQIDFRKHHFSGMLIVKQTDPATYRAVLNSYFGMKIFDFEFGKDTFQIHYCIEALNKKQVINTLQTDFSNLFFFHVPDHNTASVYISKENKSLNVYQIQPNKKKYYFLVNNETKELLKIEIPHFFSTLHYDFSDYNSDHFPGQINIRHSNIGLRFQLNRMER